MPTKEETMQKYPTGSKFIFNQNGASALKFIVVGYDKYRDRLSSYAVDIYVAEEEKPACTLFVSEYVLDKFQQID